jgi:hypothetical protein
MTDTFRALCEELVEELEDWIYCDDESEIADAHSLIDRARAALAEQPVGPTPLPGDAEGLAEVFWGRHVQPEPVGLTDEELTLTYALAVAVAVDGMTKPWPADLCERAQLAGLRAVLARWGQPTPQPPADGEVARFAGWLRAHRDQCVELGRPDWAHMVNRAAELLEQRHPTPIPVAERWPEFSDCDPQERVWTWNPVLDHWKLSRINRSVHTHWLPANALPVPADV